MDEILQTQQDPLEIEYTKHSRSSNTINQEQSLDQFPRRESNSYSLTWTHSQNPHHGTS